MDFLSWLPWVGGLGTIGLIALALLAPSVLQVAGAWLSALSPLLRGMAEGLVSFSKILFKGFMDMADNGKSIIFVLTVAALAYVGGLMHGTKTIVANPRVIVQDCNGKRTVRRKRPTTRTTKPDWRDSIFGQP